MTARKLPEIAPCPCGKKHVNVYCSPENALPVAFSYVSCPCGWEGPVRNTRLAAILAWNRQARASDVEAERRGARKVLEELRDHATEMEEAYRSEGLTEGAEACAYFSQFASLKLRTGKAIDSGEVLPAKPEPWIVSKPGVLGGKPCVRGTRITVETLQAAAKGWVHWRILKEYPGLTAEGLTAALAYRLPKKGRKRA